MQKTNEKEDMVYYAGPETVKSTILHSNTGKIIEIENNIDPKLWYWTKRCDLLDSIEELKHYFIILILFILLTSMSPVWIFAILGIVILCFMLLFCYLPKRRELKEFKNMHPIEDNYAASYSCLKKEFQRTCEFFDLLEDGYILVDYALKDNSICFKYINLSGNFCEKTFPTTIFRNVNASHTKVSIYEDFLECIIPYKLDEKLKGILSEEEKSLSKTELLYLWYIQKLKENELSVQDVDVADIIAELSINMRTYYSITEKLNALNLL